MRLYFAIGLLATATVMNHWTEVASAQLPRVEPEAVGIDSTRLEAIDGLVAEAIGDGKLPGCVICAGRDGRIGYLKSFGNREVTDDKTVPMSADTVFDMASITKPVATATSIMKLVEQGKLRLGNRVANLFPEFGVNGKDQITIQDMLIHQSGLIPDNALADYEDGSQVAWQRICELDLIAPVGTTFKYSDVNFIVLAKVVEKVSGLNVDQFSRKHIFQPLGMKETGFLPQQELRRKAAPTEKRDGTWMRGEVHDPRAFRLGGIAGHAGLFSTANDLAIYAHMMLGDGTFRPRENDQQPVQILAPRTVQVMTRGYRVSSGLRGLGWDKQTGYSSNKGDLLSRAAFGHGGFTGTVLWIDPELDLFFIFLSNRLHPDGEGSVNYLAGRILNVIASAIQAPESLPAKTDVHPVLTGIDVLQRDGYRQLADQRVGLITNHTGLNRDGQTTVQLLHQAKAVDLVTLFSPEHGIAGKLDIPEIGDMRDPKTQLPIFSLYGKTRKPTAEMLAGLDTLVFDIQDIGTRFYTYISTMGEAMRAAAEHDKRFIVLDRPNPIGGIEVAGPMLDEGKESFVGFHSLPVRHGMTIGEIARMLQSELQLELELTVIECEGWHRADLWEATNLTWVNPSPNMRSLTQALLYPGIGLLETTNLSVGRGTDTPFEIIGAPWIDGRQLSAALNQAPTPGAVFVPIEFTPESSKFAGEVCQGINIVIVNREQFEPMHVGFAIAHQLRRLHPEAWETENYLRLLGNDDVHQALQAGDTTDTLLALARQGVRQFLSRRAKFLIYP